MQLVPTDTCMIDKVRQQMASTYAGDTTNIDPTTSTWMINIVNILEQLGSPLQHVYFTQG